LAGLLVTFALGAACDSPADETVPTPAIAPIPAEESTALRDPAPEDPVPSAAEVAPFRLPDAMGADLAAEHFGDRPFRVAGEWRLRSRPRGELAVFVTDDESLHYAVVVGKLGNRTTSCVASYQYAAPEVQLLDEDFGPDLIQLRMTSIPPDDQPAPRREGRNQRRDMTETELHLFTLDATRGIRRVHHRVTSSSSIASAGFTWDERSRTLTTRVQRRNPPGRERCRRPDPITIIHAWRRDRFEETHHDQPSPPCGH
jgi:hypothetical protein